MKRQSWAPRLLTVGFAIAGATSAWSQASPYALSLFQTVNYQPNVFQAANGTDRTSDLISSTGLNFGFKQTFDGINLFANGNVQGNVYQDTKDLNNVSYGVSLGAGSTGERLASTVRLVASQNLGNYGTPGVAATTEQNLQNNLDAAFAMRYRLAPRTNLVGGLGYQSLTYSAAAFDSQENSSGVAFVDVTHKATPELTVGAGLRGSRGRTPNYAPGPTPGSFVADQFDGQYLDLLASWRPARTDTLRARISLTRTTHTQATQLDFTGITGVISWTYEASSRLAMTASLAQNTGSGPAVFGAVLAASPSGSGTGGEPAGGGTPGTGTGTGTGAGTGTGTGTGTGGTASGSSTGNAAVGNNPAVTADNNRLNTTLNFGATYQATRTIGLTGNLSFNNAELVNSADVSGNAWSAVLGLGISYVPTRSITLACNLSTTLQNASQSAESSGQAYSYRSPTVGCTGTISFF